MKTRAINCYIEHIIEYLEKGSESLVRSYFHGLNGIIFGYWMMDIVTYKEYNQLMEIKDLIADELRETGMYLYC